MVRKKGKISVSSFIRGRSKGGNVSASFLNKRGKGEEKGNGTTNRIPERKGPFATMLFALKGKSP